MSELPDDEIELLNRRGLDLFFERIDSVWRDEAGDPIDDRTAALADAYLEAIASPEEWRSHVKHPGTGQAWCGQPIVGFHLVDLEHAAGCVRKQTRVQPCGDCLAEIWLAGVPAPEADDDLVDEFKPTDGKCTCRLDDLRGVS